MNVWDDFEIHASVTHGFGCFTLRDFAAGAILGDLEGEITREDAPSVLWLGDDFGIRICAPFSFVNHGIPPNVEFGDDLRVRALRDIRAGEELLMDYGPGWS